ncbi:HipA domain-containing protein [Chryseobacterium sp.]|uniref:HipA domain-containing protein n=1 Tax=Chryseobacterium sp. TaxID=1871047 RepID=UPI0011C6F70B|nr:HipA domain-containing protein [Chryseobacterium sp.]TXF74823.1 HipA domain-containing protein [Chryseobacterium sp.]
MENKCLFCYNPIEGDDLQSPAGTAGYHPKCSKKFFGTTIPPILDLTQETILEYATSVIKTQRAVTGVQPKLSLEINEEENSIRRFTIVGLWGDFILKPQTEYYKNLPENEDITMHLAQISKIKTVEHSLIRLKSGELAYITKRTDRTKTGKIHMEDMCQLTERLTEHKYKGSYEQISKTIKRYTANSGLDVLNFYELVLFSFLTGNNDMHLKNFSLIKYGKEYSFCPAYDLVSSTLVNEEDHEEMALNLNGKKNKITRKDFEVSMMKAGIEKKAVDNLFKKFEKVVPKWKEVIRKSFLPETFQEQFLLLIEKRIEHISNNM